MNPDLKLATQTAPSRIHPILSYENRKTKEKTLKG